jgi:uncharacterized protein DUF6064
MTLPFTRDAFLDVFSQYNAVCWPAAIVLWVMTATAGLLVLRRGVAARPFALSTLVVLWAWSGVVYHFAFFSRINPAAPLFGALFVVEAVVLAWQGALLRHLQFTQHNPVRLAAGSALVAYALLYPAIVLASGGDYPRMPTFGVPCPTTIATIGFFIAADRPLPRAMAVIPILWAATAGSSAFLLGVPADLMLLVAGAAMTIDVSMPAKQRIRV